MVKFLKERLTMRDWRGQILDYLSLSSNSCGKQVEPGQRSTGVIGWIQLSRLGSFSLLARDHRFSSINFSSLFTRVCESHRSTKYQDLPTTFTFHFQLIYVPPDSTRDTKFKALKFFDKTRLGQLLRISNKSTISHELPHFDNFFTLSIIARILYMLTRLNKYIYNILFIPSFSRCTRIHDICSLECPIGHLQYLDLSVVRAVLTREFADSTVEPPNVAKCGRRPRLSPFMLISLIRYFHDFRTSQTCHFTSVLYCPDAGQADEPKTKYSRRKEIIEKQFIARAIT